MTRLPPPDLAQALVAGAGLGSSHSRWGRAAPVSSLTGLAGASPCCPTLGNTRNPSDMQPMRMLMHKGLFGEDSDGG